LDDNIGNANFTKDIIVKYLNSTETDEIKRWMYANRDMASTNDRTKPGGRPWNACVIDMRGGGKYWYWDFSHPDAQGKPTLTAVDKANW
jgi:hypothetical protein